MNTPDNFKFYLSIHETTKMLSDEEHGKLMKAIQSVQFYEVHIDSIVFENPMIKLAWASVKIQIRKQIDGFCSKKKVRYDGLFEGAMQGATEGAIQGATEQSKPQSKTQSKSKPEPKPEPQSKPEPQLTNFEKFIMGVTKEFETKKILTFKKKINKTKNTKEAFYRFDIVPNDLHIRYADYVMRNNSTASRLDVWLNAVFEKNESAIEYSSSGNQRSISTKQPEYGSIAWRMQQQAKQEQEIIDV